MGIEVIAQGQSGIFTSVLIREFLSGQNRGVEVLQEFLAGGISIRPLAQASPQNLRQDVPQFHAFTSLAGADDFGRVHHLFQFRIILCPIEEAVLAGFVRDQ